VNLALSAHAMGQRHQRKSETTTFSHWLKHPPGGAVWYIAAVKIAGEDRHRSLVNGSGTSENLEMGAGLHP
jgi:hypothetical protein